MAKIVKVEYEFPRAAVTNHHKLNDLKQQKFILSQFWKPEVQNQGVSRAKLPLEALGKGPFLSLPVSKWLQCSLACASLQFLPLSSWLSLLWVSVCPFLCHRTRSLDLGNLMVNFMCYLD